MELCFNGIIEVNVKFNFHFLKKILLNIGIINQGYVHIFDRFPPVLLNKLSTECIVMQNHKVSAYSSV